MHRIGVVPAEQVQKAPTWSFGGSEKSVLRDVQSLIKKTCGPVDPYGIYNGKNEMISKSVSTTANSMISHSKQFLSDQNLKQNQQGKSVNFLFQIHDSMGSRDAYG